jgi:hypothetical protein
VYANEKDNFVLVLNSLLPHHENVWGSGGIVSPILTSALDGGE